jgi:hypothetical protein
MNGCNAGTTSSSVLTSSFVPNTPVASSITSIPTNTKIDIAASDASQEIKANASYVCTGSADDKTINKVLKEKAGTEVMLSEGNFNISGGIIVPSNTTLQGQGQNTKIFRTTGDSKAALSLDITAEQKKFAVTEGSVFVPGQTIWLDSEYMYILGVDGNTLTVIRGHNASTVKEHKKGAKIYFWMEVIRNEKSQEGGSSNVIVRGLFVDGGSKLGFRNSQGITIRKCDYSTVENCWVQNVSGGSHPQNPETDWLRGGGIQADDSDYVTFKNDFVTGASHAGISFRNKCKFGIAMDNQVWEVGYEGIDIGNKTFKDYTNNSTTGEGCEDIEIKNNIIKNCGLLGGSGGILLDDQAVTGKGNPSRRITIENNTIFSNNSGSKMSGIIVFSNNVNPEAEWDFNIHSNTITNCTFNGIKILQVNSGVIEENNISGCVSSGISIEGSKNIKILSNMSRDNNEYGISIVHSRGISNDSNILQNNRKGTVYTLEP